MIMIMIMIMILIMIMMVMVMVILMVMMHDDNNIVSSPQVCPLKNSLQNKKRVDQERNQ